MIFVFFLTIYRYMGPFGSLWDAFGLLLSLLGAAFGPFGDALGCPGSLFGSLGASSGPGLGQRGDLGVLGGGQSSQVW